jgi:hypothetical protein
MSANKPRGGPVEWTTEEQRLWLEDRKPAYTFAQTNGSKNFRVFWATTFDSWLKRWPIEELTEKEKSEGLDKELKMKKMKEVSKWNYSRELFSSQNTLMQRIKQWYNNHNRGGAARAGQRRKILDLGKAKKQMPQWQIYSALYYKAKLKDLIHAKWETHYRELHPDYDTTKNVPKITISFVNERVREYFEAETAEVKEEIRLKAEAEQEDVLLDGENGEELEPEEQKRLKLANFQR